MGCGDVLSISRGGLWKGKNCRRKSDSRAQNSRTKPNRCRILVAARTGRTRQFWCKVSVVAGSSRGLGHGPLKAGTRVQIPYPLPSYITYSSLTHRPCVSNYAGLSLSFLTDLPDPHTVRRSEVKLFSGLNVECRIPCVDVADRGCPERVGGVGVGHNLLTESGWTIF